MRAQLPSLALAALLAGSAAAQQPIVTTVVGNGTTQSRYDLVILADGYQASERPRFDADVNACLTSMFQRPPYSTFAGYFNVHSVFRASQDSGASQPDVTPPIVKNTAYGATYNNGGVARCLYITNTALALADAALAPANEGRTLVLVNDNRYGGCAAQFAVSYNGGQMPEVQVHELGHALGSLADEYDYPNNTYTGSEPAQANLTANPAATKWQHWFGFDNISAFEGAGYYLHGLWRPRNDCLMRNLGVTLCSVCREQLSRAVNAAVNVIESPSPQASTVLLSQPASQLFSFTHFVPPANNPLIEWSVDGQVVAGQNGTSFLYDSTTVARGLHTVRVTVSDQTPLVRLDPNGLMRETRAWNVNVVDPLSCDLTIPTLNLSSTMVNPGASVTITAAVANAGPSAANGAALEVFLSTDATVQTTDVYLGSTTLPTLPAGGQTTVVRTVTLPGLLDLRYYYVIGVVNRTGAILESNGANNTRLSVVIPQQWDCVPRLELRDDLLWPRDRGAVSMTAGGSLQPTVVARCAAGQLYLIAWTASGTSPGTVVGPGIPVPLNPDPLTQLGLGLVNGAVLQGFLGVLDAQGVGRATFAWPAGAVLPVSQTHMAAVLVGATDFTAATNAIAIQLLP